MKQNTKEIWKDVPGYKNYYQASDRGNIRSVDRVIITSNGQERFYKGRVLGGTIDNDGYRKITLIKNGKRKTFTLSQIIAITYLNHTPNGNTLVVDHINGIKTDNRVENLQIVTQRQNLSTCFRKDRESLSSRFTGVYWNKNNTNWGSNIVYGDKTIHLGYFNDELKASEAYQLALSKINNGVFNPDDYRANYTSKYKGVTFHKRDKKWRSQVRVNKKYKHIGSFNTEVEAFNCVQKFKKIMKKENG